MKSDRDWVWPRISVLSAAQREQVHAWSLHLLDTVGVRVGGEAARQAFARATGGQGAGAGAPDRVRIPRALVEWALQAAPAQVEVYDRLGHPAFRLGSGEPTRFGVGVTALYYQDPQSGAAVPFAREHLARVVRLGNALPGLDVVSTPGVVQDVDPGACDLVAALEMVANTVKPLVLLVADGARFGDVLDLLAALHGDLAARPFVLPYFNPLTPLTIDAGTAARMQVAIARGLPVLFSSYGMAGATTPIAPAGALVLLNAELLAGLTLSQLFRPGAPVVLGCLPAYMDMRNMGSFYDLTSYLLNLACAEMMAHYRLPHCGTSGSGPGWGADLIAAGHQWANHLTSCLGQVGLAPFVGNTLGDKAFSPALLVYADEAIAQARRFAAGFSLAAGEAALDEIAAVGPGGDFLTTEATLRGFRQAYYMSDLLPNLTLEAWQAQGCPQAADRLRERTCQLLDGLRPPADHDELIARGEFLMEHG